MPSTRPKYRTRKGEARRRRLELAAFAPLVVTAPSDPDGWVDNLTDEQFGKLFPSWAKLTGRNVDHVITDHAKNVA